MYCVYSHHKRITISVKCMLLYANTHDNIFSFSVNERAKREWLLSTTGQVWWLGVGTN